VLRGLLVLGVIAIAGVVLLAPDHDAASRPVHHAVASHHRGISRASPVPHARVTLTAGAGVQVPRSFLGLSTEYSSLPMLESNTPVLARTLSLLKVPGDGPFVVRVGGDSADHTFWDPRLQRMPDWAYPLTPAWVRAASRLIDTARLRLILDLNLVTDSIAQAVTWAQAAERGLPRHSIVAFEIGNEPDLYSRWYWRALLAIPAGSPTVLPPALTPRMYAEDFSDYADALRHLVAGVPVAGPAIANPIRHRSWLAALVARARPDLSFLTAHRYPLSECARPGSPAFPTLARVLGDGTSEGLASDLAPVVGLAHRHGLALRLTELNSVTCGGRRRVSNAFATALWAPDALFALLRTGVSSVDIHVRTRTFNAAFTIDRRRGLVAHPLLYGMIMFAQALGNRPERLLATRTDAAPALDLKTWAVRDAGGGLRVLLIDKGRRPIDVAVRLPSTGDGVVSRLLAPSAAAVSGETFTGQWLGADGRWHGQRRPERIVPGPDGYAVRMPARSAALLSVAA
jgi:hypothetical protein